MYTVITLYPFLQHPRVVPPRYIELVEGLGGIAARPLPFGGCEGQPLSFFLDEEADGAALHAGRNGEQLGTGEDKASPRSAKTGGNTRYVNMIYMNCAYM